MDKLNLNGLQAALSAQMTAIVALFMTHPDRAALRKAFAHSMQAVIEEADDPEVSGVLSAYEEALREALDGPGVQASD